MYDETNVPGPEYRVRTVVRYIVTRYCHPFVDRNAHEVFPGSNKMAATSKVMGEFQTEQQAWDVASALAKAEPSATVQDNP